MTRLFDPLDIRGLRLRNRIVVSPMCQYSAVDGRASDYHLVHLGRFALGGFGLIIVEATAVSEEGRLTYGDLGLWEDEQIEPLRRIADFVHAQGAHIGLQLAHAGPKGATLPPWVLEEDRPPEADWEIYSATDAPYEEGWQRPIALTREQLEGMIQHWRAATRRAIQADMDVVEIHMAHGYLLHTFLSPLTNARDDEYGGELEGRMKFPLQVVAAVREEWPDERPLSVRISVVDNGNDGISIEQSVEFAVRLKELGVDLIDCSTGGIGGRYVHDKGYGYQVSWSAKVRSLASVPTVAVGLITSAVHADVIISNGDADLVALGREALADPSWPAQARETLKQYEQMSRFDLLPIQSRSWLERRQVVLDRIANSEVTAESSTRNSS